MFERRNHMASVKDGWGIGYGNQGAPKSYTDKNSEIERTKAVIDNRMNQGMDTSAQLSHYKNLTGQDYQVSKPSSAGQSSSSAPNNNQPSYMQAQQGGVNSIYDQMKDAQLAAMRAAREKAIGNINYQKSLVAPQYQSSRNQADVVNAQNVQRLREMMATNGLNASGENVSATVALQSARQKSLNDLNLQEQQTINDYDRQITDLNNPADELALIANIESQRAQALYQDGIRVDETNYNRQQDAFNNSLAESQITGKYNGQDTYQSIRDKVSDAQWEKSLAFQKEQFKSEQDWRKFTYTTMSAYEKAQLEQNKFQFGEEMAWKMYEMKYQGQIALSQNQAQIDFYNGSATPSSAGGAGTNSSGSKASGPQSFQSNMAQAVKMGVNQAWVPLLSEIVKRESSFNPTAKNPKSTAYGYGQFLKATRNQYEAKTGLDYDNPVHQLVMMAQYVKDRYKTPEAALAFWNKNKWY